MSNNFNIRPAQPDEAGLVLEFIKVDLPRLEPARLEGVPLHRSHPDGRMDGAAAGRAGIETVCGKKVTWEDELFLFFY